jgi:hypothetical protein
MPVGNALSFFSVGTVDIFMKDCAPYYHTIGTFHSSVGIQNYDRFLHPMYRYL